jgi:hypothetical protein
VCDMLSGGVRYYHPRSSYGLEHQNTKNCDTGYRKGLRKDRSLQTFILICLLIIVYWIESLTMYLST